MNSLSENQITLVPRGVYSWSGPDVETAGNGVAAGNGLATGSGVALATRGNGVGSRSLPACEKTTG